MKNAEHGDQKGQHVQIKRLKEEEIEVEVDEIDMSLCGKISKHIAGIICLLIMVINWVAYAEVLQTFKGGYDHLFFIRYCAVSCYMLYIIPWYFVHKHGVKKLKMIESNNINCIKKVVKHSKQYEDSMGAALYSSLDDNSMSKSTSKPIHYETNGDMEYSEKLTINNDDNNDIDKEKQKELEPTFKFMSRIKYGIIFIGITTYLCGYLWYVSLSYTTVAANNTIYQSQCVFVLLLSCCFLETKLTLKKVMAMLMAVGGTAMVSFGATTTSDDSITTTWYGYVICLISMILYAIQEVSTSYVGEKYFRDNLEVADNFLLLFGMGMISFICMWPGLFILDWAQIEEFVLPQTYDQVLSVVVIVAFEAVFIGTLMTGVMLSGPILISLGTLSIIPLSFVCDVWLHGLQITVFAVVGSFLIFFSFIAIEIPTKKIMRCIN